MMLCKLLSHLDQGKFSSRVVSLMPPGFLSDKIESAGIPVVNLGIRRGRVVSSGFLKLARLLVSWKPCVLHTWMYHANLLGVLVSKLFRIPKLVWSIRCSDVPFDEYRPLTGWIVKLCAHLSAIPDAIIVNSRAGMSEHVRLGYRAPRMCFVPNGFDLDCFRPDPMARSSVRRELGIPEESIIIGLVGRWDPLKDHTTFVQAAAHIAREYENAYFLLIGSGMERETPKLTALIDEVGLKDKAILLGLRHDVPRLTAAFDIACSSSSTEGFPTTIGEAMSCGVPCVVTDVGDSAVIVGDTGRVVPRGDSAAFASACLELIQMGSTRRQELGREGRELIRKRYSLTMVVEEYEKVYRRLLSKDSEA